MEQPRSRSIPVLRSQHPPEPILEHAAHVKSVTHVRSTLIQSSLAGLRERGHFERYVAQLSSVHRDTILGTLAPVWMPIDVGRAHYGACEALDLDDDELRAMGQNVAERIQGTFLRSLTQTARAVGVTPWAVLGQLQRIWARLFMEGSLSAGRVGPKDCVIELLGLPLVETRYFRAAICGVVAAGLSVAGARSALVRAVTWDDDRGQLTLRGAWV